MGVGGGGDTSYTILFFSVFKNMASVVSILLVCSGAVLTFGGGCFKAIVMIFKQFPQVFKHLLI